MDNHKDTTIENINEQSGSLKDNPTKKLKFASDSIQDDKLILLDNELLSPCDGERSTENHLNDNDVNDCISNNNNNNINNNYNSDSSEDDEDDDARLIAASSSKDKLKIYKLDCNSCNKKSTNKEIACSCTINAPRKTAMSCKRSKSWCGVNDATMSNEIVAFRESFRLLRTQARPQTTTIRNFTKSQLLTLLSLLIVDFMSFCSMSIMAPFFPREAEEKGLSEAVTGFVFSFYALVMFLASPIFGKILPLVGAKFLFISGIFVTGVCNLLFGVLEYIYDYGRFTTFCFMIRAFEALGASAYSTASYVFVVNTFPDHISSVLGILETSIGLGSSVGPAIGGLLYSVGGFGLPFYVLGTAMVLTIPINFYLLPGEEENPIQQQTGSILNLIKVPTVLITSLVIIAVSNTWAFLDPTLEPHLRQFGLSTEHIGLIFLLFSGLYGLFSPIWGCVADKVDRHWCMMVWGLLFCTVGLLLLGPSPLLPFLESSLMLNIIGLSIIGISVALTLLPTFQGVLSSSIEEGGCNYNIATYGVVAGVWSCMYSLGEVMGPSLGGLLLKNYGFPICSTVMASFTFVLAIVTLLFFVIKENVQSCNSNSSEYPSASTSENVYSDSSEYQPLIKNENKKSEIVLINNYGGIDANFNKNRSKSVPGDDFFANKHTDNETKIATQELLKYNIDKVNYYKKNRQENNNVDECDEQEKTDVKGTVNISLSGACEV